MTFSSRFSSLPDDILSEMTSYLSVQDIAILYQSGSTVLNYKVTQNRGVSDISVALHRDSSPTFFRRFSSLESFAFRITDTPLPQKWAFMNLMLL